MNFLSIGAYWPVWPKSQTPFLGGGLGVTGVEGGGDLGERSGLLVYLGGGMLLYRTSNVGLRLHGGYFAGAFNLDNSERDIPHGLLVNLEISFGK